MDRHVDRHFALTFFRHQVNDVVSNVLLAEARSIAASNTDIEYDAYMLDLSQYAGEHARRDFEMVKFWGPDSDDALRKASLIYLERQLAS